MSVSFQPQIWGDKLFSPLQNAIQRERDRQHQKDLSDARNALTQQQLNQQQERINMQKEAVNVARNQQKAESDVYKSVLERALEQSKYDKSKQDYISKFENDKTFRAKEIQKEMGGLGWNPFKHIKGLWSMKYDDAKDAEKMYRSQFPEAEIPPLNISEDAIMTPNMLNFLQYNQPMSTLSVDQLLQIARGNQ